MTRATSAKKPVATTKRTARTSASASKKPSATTKRKPAAKSARSSTTSRAASRRKTPVAQSIDAFSSKTTPLPSPPPTPAPTTAPSPTLDPQLLALQAEQAARVLCKRRLIPFVQRLNPRYDAGWVHKDIARRLERFSDDVEKGLSPRLMLLMPPRHGKSELASRLFPAWHLGRYPDHEIIACSYNVSLAMSFSRKVKEVLDDPAYQSVFATRLHPDFQSNEEWAIHNHRGGYVAAGVGGGITGKGAHVLIVDDPIKNAEEADSPDIREKLFDWYGSTAYTRLAPGGGVLVIQTWWHDDDLAGRLQIAMAEDPDADQFEVVKYPAIAEDDELLDLTTDAIVQLSAVEGDLSTVDKVSLELHGFCASHRRLRRKGEALHRARYDEKKLARIKKNIAPRFWSALYQQNPVPDDGGYFTKDQFLRAATPNIKRSNVYIAWDFAISEKKQNDWTVGSAMYHDDDDDLHVADVRRFKTQNSFFMVEQIIDFAEKHMTRGLVVGFEDGQIWKAISALLYKRMRERRVIFAIEVLTPITDKMARARPLQGRMQQGRVKFPASEVGWFQTVKNEMLRFPAGVHDDCVDSLAWCASLAIGKQAPAKPKTTQMKSWRDRIGGLVRGGGATHMAA